MDPQLLLNPHENIPFTRNLDKLIASLHPGNSPLNIFQYIILAHILLGHVSELIHSLHSSPSTPDYAEECSELDSYLVRLRLAIPRQAASIFEAAPDDRAHVIWLQAVLNTICILLYVVYSLNICDFPADSLSEIIVHLLARLPRRQSLSQLQLRTT